MNYRLTVGLLTLSAILSFSAALYLYNQQHIDLSKNISEATTAKRQPTRLIIKELDLNLPIYEAEISEGKWQTTKEGVSYLKASPMPGEIGNSIIYGHNWTNLLGNLPKLSDGSKITVRFSDGTFVDFAVTSKSVVTKDQTHILDQENFSKLTLYTCDSFLDSKRFVVTALPK